MSGLHQTPLSQPVAFQQKAAAPAAKRPESARLEPAILFFTGLSGAGKSTLARGLEARLRAAGRLVSVIDGDQLRAGLCRDLGFTEADRHENLRRATELALHLAEVGATVIVALIAPFRADRAAAARGAAEKGIPFAEIFINAPLAVCEQRDPKKLYQRARAGKLAAFTGIDSPYEPPQTPALELRTDRANVETCIEELTRFVNQLGSAKSERRGPAAAHA